MMMGLIKKCQDSAHQRFSFRGGAQCFEREAQYAGFVVAFVSYSGAQIDFPNSAIMVYASFVAGSMASGDSTT